MPTERVNEKDEAAAAGPASWCCEELVAALAEVERLRAALVDALSVVRDDTLSAGERLFDLDEAEADRVFREVKADERYHAVRLMVRKIVTSTWEEAASRV